MTFVIAFIGLGVLALLLREYPHVFVMIVFVLVVIPLVLWGLSSCVAAVS